MAESDLDRDSGAVLVRRGKGGRRREVAMDRWAWEQLDRWLAFCATLPVGALFCVLRGVKRRAALTRARCGVAAFRRPRSRRFEGFVAGSDRREPPHSGEVAVPGGRGGRHARLS